MIYGRGVALRGRGSTPGGGHCVACGPAFSSKRVARAHGHSGSYRVKPVIAATPQEAGCMVPPVVTEIAAGVLTGL